MSKSSREKYKPADEKYKTADIMGMNCLMIENVHRLQPFLISVVSDEDHWMFLSSHGGITAGRRDADNALFPYYTEDKIVDGAESTGSQTLIAGHGESGRWLWEPFSIRGEGRFEIERNLYKSIWGEAIIFEEVNRTLNLLFRHAWMTSGKYGIVKKSEIINSGTQAVKVEILDGIRNILPSGVTSQTQNEYSCLLDAYKDARRIDGTGVAVYKMSSLLTDRAEPSEALLATVAWTASTDTCATLLSESQVKLFRSGKAIESESATRGLRGAYYTLRRPNLETRDAASWYIVANLNQTQGQLVSLLNALSDVDAVRKDLVNSIHTGARALRAYVGLSDGLQVSSAGNVPVHHYANTLFNIMRGGVFPHAYRMEVGDFQSFLEIRNISLAREMRSELSTLPAWVDLHTLNEWVCKHESVNLRRQFLEYLPLGFSRRHGDPSRPWNHFVIDIRDEDGRRKMSYQGNWRDIFQNWEALALSFPCYISHFIAKFLNAITLDGYNPYRVTRDGIEWEVPEPNNPWANIGYWGDHQVIYLQRFLEMWERFEPGALSDAMSRRLYTHADIPYRIRPYDEIIQDPRNTIVFDVEKDHLIRERVRAAGSDGRLVRNGNGDIVHSTLLEKLLIILLAKISNFVPGGGIWMNTQRPEWNDANNALVGFGLSVVTLCYVRRMAVFLVGILDAGEQRLFSINRKLDEFFAETKTAFESVVPEELLEPSRRMEFMNRLGASASSYRERVYGGGFDENTQRNGRDVIDLLNLVIRHADVALRNSRRQDGLFNSYNILDLGGDKARIRELQVMLEGQVAVLSSGFLNSPDALDLLRELRRSPLYRADQDSYMLYPDRELPDFLDMNRIPPGRVESIPLLAAMAETGNAEVVAKDAAGTHRFHADFRNAEVLSERLNELLDDPKWRSLASESHQDVLDLYEEVFNHMSFTGRSGTFYAYEGLGSIYWHMVSKLLLAVQESAFKALDEEAPEAEELVQWYDRVRSGLSCNKSPEVYGAFVTDPYSHTPSGRGAKQPGMTGQVKEEIITRLGELGVVILNGQISFRPRILLEEEYLESSRSFEYIDAAGQWCSLEVEAGSVAFTYCGVPVCYESRRNRGMRVVLANGTVRTSDETALSADESRSIFRREGKVKEIHVGAG